MRYDKIEKELKEGYDIVISKDGEVHPSCRFRKQYVDFRLMRYYLETGETVYGSKKLMIHMNSEPCDEELIIFMINHPQLTFMVKTEELCYTDIDMIPEDIRLRWLENKNPESISGVDKHGNNYKDIRAVLEKEKHCVCGGGFILGSGSTSWSAFKKARDNIHFPEDDVTNPSGFILYTTDTMSKDCFDTVSAYGMKGIQLVNPDWVYETEEYLTDTPDYYSSPYWDVSFRKRNLSDLENHKRWNEEKKNRKVKSFVEGAMRETDRVSGYMRTVPFEKALAESLKTNNVVATCNGSFVGLGYDCAQIESLKFAVREARKHAINQNDVILHIKGSLTKDSTEFLLINQYQYKIHDIQVIASDRDCLESTSNGDYYFKKFDTGSLRYDKIPVEFLRAMAELYTKKPETQLNIVPVISIEAMEAVMSYGAKKYGFENWQKCEDLNRYIGASMRHFEAYRAGELEDSESGLPHLWHCITNVAFLIWLEEAKKEESK